MAHKTMIDGTAYTVKGGRTLVDGTAYAISKGRTLVDGTGYDVNFKKWVEKQDTGVVTSSTSMIIAEKAGGKTLYLLKGTGYSFDASTGTFTLTGTSQASVSYKVGYTTNYSQASTVYLVASYDGYPAEGGHSVIWKFPTSNVSRGRISNSSSSIQSIATIKSSSRSYSVGYVKLYSAYE